jgi:hypothetical protein
MNYLKKLLGPNWKSNAIATVAALYGVPQVVVAGQQWLAHKPVDWHGVAYALFITALGYVTKDSSNKSTSADVAAADAKVGIGSTVSVPAPNVAPSSVVPSQTLSPLNQDEKVLAHYGVKPAK